MKLIKFITYFALLLACEGVLSQSTPQLVISAKVVDSGIELNWFPTNPIHWKDGMKNGYTLIRESNSGNTNNFKPITILPKSKEWFTSNVTAEDGVLFVVGEVLFNPDFNLPETENKDSWNLKYNYVVFESIKNTKVASPIGLGFTDSGIKKAEQYTYTIKDNSTGNSASVSITANDDQQIQSPLNYYHDFDFPDDQSLSDIVELSQPFVLKAILGKARPLLDSVVLRWAPSTPEIWRQAMIDGYDIYRLDEAGTRSKLTSVYPWNENKFKSIDLRDSLALLAASFVKDKGYPQKMQNENFYEQAAMGSNIHGFALMIADRSPLAAEILGLRFVDRDVKPGETYVYQIATKNLVSNIPVSDIRVINEFEPLMAPEGFIIIKEENTVTLQWLANSNMTNYGSYVVERALATDSVFQVLTNPPLVFMNDPALPQSYFMYKDTLHDFQVYNYRLKGSNAFGEWSDYAYGLGYRLDRTPPPPVVIYDGIYEEDSSRLKIVWDLPNDISDTKYHQVLLSDNADFNYSAVSEELLPTETVFYFNVKDLDTDRPFYFQVMSMDSSGNQALSITRYVSVPDLEKPLAVENFKATIDTNGLVLATWSPSKSLDVQGYYVYFSNDDGTDLTLQNNYLHTDTFYSWSIALNSLTKYIYIGVKAEDDNYNKSPISEIIRLRRPDKIPPPKPFLNQAFLDENNKVYLTWKQSSAIDVDKYIVFRKNNKVKKSEWQAIDTLSKEDLEYFDDTYPENTQLSYAIKAADDFNNISEISNAIPVNVPFNAHKYKLDFSIDKESGGMSTILKWKKEDVEKLKIEVPFTFEIFKSLGDEELEIFKEVPSAQFMFSDNVYEKNVLHNYSIRIKFDGEKFGALSESKSIIIN